MENLSHLGMHAPQSVIVTVIAYGVSTVSSGMIGLKGFRIITIVEKRKAEEAGRKRKEEQERAERLAAEQQRKEAEKAAAEKARQIRRHSLTWPSTGEVLNRFGSIRSGQVRWKGLLFGTGNSLVKAAGSGTVVMVTAMKRLGTVIIVDHGGGFISIYCNNLNSLKKQGDHVEQGELIGYTGTSQGLYFELRKDGESVSPAEYLRRR